MRPSSIPIINSPQILMFERSFQHWPPWYEHVDLGLGYVIIRSKSIRNVPGAVCFGNMYILYIVPL